MTTPRQPDPDNWIDAYGRPMKLRIGEAVTILCAALWQKLTRAERRRDKRNPVDPFGS